jgi:hypothetical protein
MNDLRAWCEGQRGRKTELANTLDIDRQRVSDWLAGCALPSLDTGLQLYHILQRERSRKANRPVKEDTPTQQPSQVLFQAFSLLTLADGARHERASGQTQKMVNLIPSHRHTPWCRNG